MIKIEYICPTRAGGNIVLDLQKDTKNAWKVNNKFKLKEGTINTMQLTFKVHHDIVYGLKYACTIKKGFVTVSEEEENVGSFSPVKEDHVIKFTPEEVPSGFMARLSYQGKAKLFDLDGNIHLVYDFEFEISSDW